MDDLIERHMGLVVSVVNSFHPKSAVEKEDYIQAGRIGLWKALEKHDPQKSALSTYAWNPIRWEIIKEIKSIKADRYCSITEDKNPAYVTPETLWEHCPDSLSIEESELIDLRKMGYTLQEIADILGRGRSYVKRVVYKAVHKIRECNE
jgi:RNA polymerase sigma factor (sigma-70 family)